MDSPVARQSFTNYSQSSNSDFSPYGNEFVPEADMHPSAKEEMTEDPFGLGVINSRCSRVTNNEFHYYYSPEEVAKIQKKKHLLAMTKEESLEAKMEHFYAREEFGNLD